MSSVQLVVESPLDQVVLTALVQRRPSLQIGTCYITGGRAVLEKRISLYNQAARNAGLIFVCLADLDRDECAPFLIQRWLPQGTAPTLLLRVAVPEVESWLLADRLNFAAFLGVPANKISLTPEAYADPKAEVIQLAKKSRYPVMRRDIVPAENSTARVGRAYNDRLSAFVLKHWDVDAACKYSPSLQRAVRAVERFSPPKNE
ncbi:MAG: hypothetical protein HXY40_16905 [Chloroflexi bacterium]|nr:hypothetical protein [Chloroflexota bacterium]